MDFVLVFVQPTLRLKFKRIWEQFFRVSSQKIGISNVCLKNGYSLWLSSFRLKDTSLRRIVSYTISKAQATKVSTSIIKLRKKVGV